MTNQGKTNNRTRTICEKRNFELDATFNTTDRVFIDLQSRHVELNWKTRVEKTLKCGKFSEKGKTAWREVATSGRPV